MFGKHDDCGVVFLSLGTPKERKSKVSGVSQTAPSFPGLNVDEAREYFFLIKFLGSPDGAKSRLRELREKHEAAGLDQRRTQK